MRCEGWRKYGGMMTLGPVVWRQCENDATVMLEVEQEGVRQTLPGCAVCWQEAIDSGITILNVYPINSEGKKGKGGEG